MEGLPLNVDAGRFLEFSLYDMLLAVCFVVDVRVVELDAIDFELGVLQSGLAKTEILARHAESNTILTCHTHAVERNQM